MFTGFSDETFEFFMAIKFNNNREFFHANHDLYVRALREPCLQLAAALADAANALDPEIDTRPDKVVSRINRDLRFSKDKSPYRDYIWLAFRRPGADRSTTLSAYVDLGMEGMGCGIGFYGNNKPLMNGLRRQLRIDPGQLLSVLPDANVYEQNISAVKRMPLPEGLPESLADWYRAKGFYLTRNIRDFSLIKSPEIVDVLRASFKDMEPMYHYIGSLTPEEGDE